MQLAVLPELAQRYGAQCHASSVRDQASLSLSRLLALCPECVPTLIFASMALQMNYYVLSAAVPIATETCIDHP